MQTIQSQQLRWHDLEKYNQCWNGEFSLYTWSTYLHLVLVLLTHVMQLRDDLWQEDEREEDVSNWWKQSKTTQSMRESEKQPQLINFHSLSTLIPFFLLNLLGPLTSNVTFLIHLLSSSLPLLPGAIVSERTAFFSTNYLNFSPLKIKHFLKRSYLNKSFDKLSNLNKMFE